MLKTDNILDFRIFDFFGNGDSAGVEPEKVILSRVRIDGF
jgi:hypothetical protein